MAVEPKTLNIPEKQVLVDFRKDEGDLFFHRRILLVATNATGKWICATPDYEVALVDLSEHKIVPLPKTKFSHRIIGATSTASTPPIAQRPASRSCAARHALWSRT